MTTRRLSTAFLTLFAALLTAAGLSLVLAVPAHAHSELISSTPADGEESYEVPEAVTLEFNETIQDIGNEIVITGPDGSAVTDGDPQVDGATVTQALAPAEGEAAIGSYAVTWRVVSADGHPISGEFTFEVLRGTVGDTVEATTEATTEEATNEEATSAEATTTEATTTSSSGEAVEDEDGGGSAAIPAIIVVVVLAAAVVAVLVIRRRRAR